LKLEIDVQNVLISLPVIPRILSCSFHWQLVIECLAIAAALLAVQSIMSK